MINLSYRFDQNSSSLELAGMPDVSKGDSENTIGIISSWTLKMIGSLSNHSQLPSRRILYQKEKRQSELGSLEQFLF